MPRNSRIDSGHFLSALETDNAASRATLDTFESVPVQNTVKCIYSMVGWLKLLRIINFDVYPIWDSKILTFRGFPSRHYNMNRVDNYLAYVCDVHAIV